MSSTQTQLRRGTTAEHSGFTGAEGEVTVDTTKDVVVVHDGSTPGGFPMLRAGSVDAGDVSCTPAGSISATDVQSALEEIAAEAQPLDSDLSAIAGLSSTGMIARTGTGTMAVRTLTAGNGISVSNGNGVSGNPTVALADGDRGDVTVSGSGATVTIDNDVVTYAKMQNVSATDKVLGRSTSGAGDVEEIPCTVAGRALLAAADAEEQREELGFTEIDGTDGDLFQRVSGNWTNSTPTEVADSFPTASTTQRSVVEIATAAEINTGTDAARAVSPDTLAGSNFGIRVVQIPCFGNADPVTTGDGAAPPFRVPSIMNGMNLVGAAACVFDDGTTGTTDIQIRRVRSGSGADMLSTKITIDSGEFDSATAATPAVIDGANDDVATADQIFVDVDAVSSTPPDGLVVELQFQLP